MNGLATMYGLPCASQWTNFVSCPVIIGAASFQETIRLECTGG